MLSGQIRSYCKTLIANKTNRIVMPLRRCVIRRRLEKSDRIGYRDVLCVSLRFSVIIGNFRNCFNFANEKRLAGKFRCNNQVKRS